MPSVAASKKSAKKVSKAAKPVKKPAEVGSKSYKELITEGLVELKDRKGASRLALKKFIKAKYPKSGSSAGFDLHFNNAVKKGVESGDFEQPKGPSGPLKLCKKTTDKPATTKRSTSPAEKKVVKKPSPPALSYKEMITQAILELNHGKGSSRPALKKYVKDHNPSTTKANSNFDHLFNMALKKGVGLGEFAQPKGPSGIVKINPKKKNMLLTSKKAV
ncbi:hypothetical protein HG536_0A07300 [Torulaspora globosa]|uniref:Histone H1 n=1 Tax=Torulaspora globosa TaxID=48254 RepID=A0A7G3ZBM9_9SACH|nr:uncharacterized protein HG536_0A07300 [Torulaspora globosa]QLL30915.1 hypothetical protein HG536_0A07300 [Torulaspora globosa]